MGENQKLNPVDVTSRLRLSSPAAEESAVQRLYDWVNMQKLRGVSVTLTVAAALALVFYNGPSRRLEIGLLIAFGALLSWELQFIKAPRPTDNTPPKHLDVKQIHCWFFAYMAVRYVVDPRLSMIYAVHLHYASLPLRNLVTIILYTMVPIVSSIAWWTVWKRKRWARLWGITASVTYLLLFLHPIVFYPGSAWWHSWNILLLGIWGLVVFVPSGDRGCDVSILT